MRNKQEIRVFVDIVFKKMKTDTAYRARLSRASSDILEWGAWETIYRTGDLQNENLRKIYAMCLSSMAQSKMECDGDIKLGEGFKLLQPKGENDISPRMRRLLSTDDPKEICQVLGPSLRYMVSKGIQLSYTSLLFDLCRYSIWENERDSIRTHWVEQYLKGESKCLQ